MDLQMLQAKAKEITHQIYRTMVEKSKDHLFHSYNLIR